MDETGKPVQIAGLTFGSSTHEAFLEGQPLGLTKTEFRLLLFLIQSDGRVFARKEIIAAVQGDDYPVSEHSVDGHIMSLRKKLGIHAHLIETVRGVGYRRRTV
jgi:two-component system phosphate regulon response regulator PhoB